MPCATGKSARLRPWLHSFNHWCPLQHQLEAVTGRRWQHETTDVKTGRNEEAITPDEGDTARKRHGTIHKLNPYVSTQSLNRTLEQHRDANQASKVRKLTVQEDPRYVRPTGLKLRTLPWKQKATLPAQIQQALFRRSSPFHNKSHNSPTPEPLYGESDLSFDRVEKVEMALELKRRAVREHWLQQLDKRAIPPETDWNSTNEVLKVLKKKELIIRRTVIWKKSSDSLRTTLPPRDLLEYQGANVRLPNDNVYFESWEPWTSRRNRQLERLEEDVEGFTRWIQPTPKEIKARESVTRLTKSIIRTAAPEVNAAVFGTGATGLATAMSDIDIRLYCPTEGERSHEDERLHEGERSYEDERLHEDEEPSSTTTGRRKRRVILCDAIGKVASALASHPDFDLDSIMTVRLPFPLVQATHTPSGITVQVVGGPQSATRSRKFVVTSLNTFPGLKSVYHILKVALARRGLLSPYHGHLSSYALFNLIVAGLRARQTMYNALTKPETWSRDIPISKLQKSKFKFCENISAAYFFPSLWPWRDPQQDTVSPMPSATPSPALALVDTVHFIDQLDTYTFGLSAHDGLLFPKRMRAPPEDLEAAKSNRWLNDQILMCHPQPQLYLLCLQDGADPSNDLGRRANGWKHAQATLRHLNSFLRSALNNEIGTRPDPYIFRGAPPRHLRAPPPPPDSPQQPPRRWTFDSGLAPTSAAPGSDPLALDADHHPPISLLREFMGRVDLAYKSTRSHLEAFADGKVPWKQAQALREGETDEDREARRVRYTEALAPQQQQQRQRDEVDETVETWPDEGALKGPDGTSL